MNGRWLMMKGGEETAISAPAGTLPGTGGPLGTLSCCPRELRDMIYQYVLDFDSDISQYLSPDKYRAFDLNRKNLSKLERYPRFGIVAASKQLYEESFRVIFTSNTFTATVTDGREYHPDHYGIKNSWLEKDNHFLTVAQGAFGFGSYYSTLPSKLKDMTGLIKHWTVTLPTYFAADGIKETESLLKKRATCDMIISFIREHTKRHCLEVEITYHGEGDPRTKPEAENYGIEKLLTLRGVANFSVVSVKDDRIEDIAELAEDIRHTEEFGHYIHDTVKLSEGTKADPFEGDRYVFVEREEEEDSDTDFEYWDMGEGPRHFTWYGDRQGFRFDHD